MPIDKLPCSVRIGIAFVLTAFVSCSLAALPYTGVNLSGAEYITPATFWPTTQEVDFFASRGMNIIRLPIAWEVIQPVPLADFNSTAWSRYTPIVDYITNTKGLHTIIDVHNYARYNGKIVGQDVPLNYLTDLWTRIADYYKSNAKVIFGMMNEPNKMSTLVWANNANSTVQVIRETGATNIILVPGNGWTGAYSWNLTWPDSLGKTSNAQAMLGVVDPLDKIIYEFHQYFDDNASGTKPVCGARPLAVPRLAPATDWLKKYNKKGFLGEFGGSDQQNCLDAFNDALTHMEDNSDVWMGWTYWTGGPRTSNGFLAITPVGYPPLQNTILDTLMNYTANPATAMIYPNLTALSCGNTEDWVIYDDALKNGWTDGGWSAARTFKSDQPSSGTYAISFNSSRYYEGLTLTYNNNFTFMNYNAIQFDVKGAVADVSYEIHLIQGKTSPGRSQIVRGYTPSHAITTSYQTAIIPFSVFHLDASELFRAIVIQSTTDAQNFIFLDNVKLVCTDIAGGVLSGINSTPVSDESPVTVSSPEIDNQSPTSTNPPSKISATTSIAIFGSTFVLSTIAAWVVFM